MIDNFNENYVNKTLLEIGIPLPKDLKIVYYSPAEKTENKKIYEKVNNMLLSISDKKNPGALIHITGEMIALKDPLHCKLCRKIWNKYRSRCTMIFFLPPEYQEPMIVNGILRYNQIAFKNSSWINHLKVFDLLSDDVIDLYASPTLEKIHYSIYNSKYIILQEKHEHMVQHIKKIWVLESKFLYNVLLDRAKKIKNDSEFIQPILFKQFTSSISSSIALHVLFYLNDMKKIDRKDFYNEFKNIKLFKESYLNDLKTIKFVEEINGFLKLSKSGREYLELFI